MAQEFFWFSAICRFLLYIRIRDCRGHMVVVELNVDDKGDNAMTVCRYVSLLLLKDHTCHVNINI
jgi:hypothetical protein